MVKLVLKERTNVLEVCSSRPDYEKLEKKAPEYGEVFYFKKGDREGFLLIGDESLIDFFTIDTGTYGEIGIIGSPIQVTYEDDTDFTPL